MGCGSLGEIAIGLSLGGVNQIGKFHRVLNEEHGHVVADDVPVALFRVKFHGKAADVARQVWRSFITGDGGESHECRCLFARPLKQIRRGDVRKVPVIFEISMSAVASRVNHAFRNPLMIEVEDLLTEMRVFE